MHIHNFCGTIATIYIYTVVKFKHIRFIKRKGIAKVALATSTKHQTSGQQWVFTHVCSNTKHFLTHIQGVFPTSTGVYSLQMLKYVANKCAREFFINFVHGYSYCV